MGYGRNIARIAILGLLSCPVVMAGQQADQSGQASQSSQASQSAQSSQSAADATHKPADQQKQAAKPKPVVWTNDNLPTDPSGVSVVGQPAPPPTPATANADKSAPASSGASAAGASKAGPPDPKQIAADLTKAKADLEDAKKQLAVLQIDLTILERQHKLDSDSYYGQTNFAADTQGKAKLDTEKTDIDSKTNDVHAQEEKVSALQKVVQTLTDEQKAAGPQASPQS